MKSVLAGLALMAATGLSWATPAASNPANSEVLEFAVQGLNCTLCSDAMKEKLVKLTGARDIEPQVECGRIYLEVDKGTKVPEGPVSLVMMSNGFNYKGMTSSSMSMTQVREAAAKGAC